MNGESLKRLRDSDRDVISLAPTNNSFRQMLTMGIRLVSIKKKRQQVTI